jgi:hypothetical protein
MMRDTVLSVLEVFKNVVFLQNVIGVCGFGGGGGPGSGFWGGSRFWGSRFWDQGFSGSAFSFFDGVLSAFSVSA